MSENNRWCSKYLTAAQILEEIENISLSEEMPDSVVILPPADTGAETDADSGDEDEYNLNRLNCNQLNAPAEVSFDKDDIIDEDEPTKEDHQKKSKPRHWEIGSNVNFLPTPPEVVFIPPLTLSQYSEPVQFFKLFVSEEIMEMLVMYTNNYASQKNSNLHVDSGDLYAFIAILLLSGYVTCSRRRMYWENRADSGNTLVRDTMRRNHFDEIFHNIHACDNLNLDKSDKYAKIRPLITEINKQFLRYAPIESNISVDESMIKYFGKHSCKQFIRNKPIRFGYKSWSMAIKSGYCIQFDLYQGKSVHKEDLYRKDFGLGGSVVLNFSDLLKKCFPGIRFALFFDNFFTSAKLITELYIKEVGATGTVRENRTEKCSLLNSKVMKRSDRGTIDSRIDKDNCIVAIRWMDNSVVTMLSNQYGVEPMKKTSRYSLKEKKRIDIPQPYAINMYNKYMGGVDQMDNHISNYKICIRGKKWYIPILFWIFDVAVNNAWILSKSFGLKLDKLEFVRSVVEALCQTYGTKRTKSGPSRQNKVSQMQKDIGRHLVLTGQKRRNCAHCKNKTVTACENCDVPLHDKCFIDYHK